MAKGGPKLVAKRMSMLSAADANRLHSRASVPPAILTEIHNEERVELLKKIEGRLDDLKIDWLVERFKELSAPLKKKCLESVDGI